MNNKQNKIRKKVKAIGKKKTLEEIKNILKDRNLFMVDESEYINTKSKISLINIEGYKYLNTIDYMRDVNKLDRFSNKNPHTIYNIKLWLKLHKYNNELLSTEYKNSDEKLIFTCSCCNKPYEVSFKHFRNANQINCKKCARELSTEKCRHDLDGIRDFYNNKGLRILDNQYSGVKQRLLSTTVEGYKVMISYNSLKASGGYEMFSKSNPYTIYNINKYIELNDIKCKLVSDEYLGSKNRIDFECSCGNIFTTTLNSFLHQNKIKCDKCSKKQSSYSLITEYYLKKYNIKYEKEYRFNDCRDKYPLPFDFSILDKDKNVLTIIEVDGEQHFYPVNFNGTKKESIERFEITKYHDNIKDEYCKLNNINLIRIPYWEFDNKNYINILNKEIYTQV